MREKYMQAAGLSTDFITRLQTLTSESSSGDTSDVASTKSIACADQLSDTVESIVSLVCFIIVNKSVPKELKSDEVCFSSAG